MRRYLLFLLALLPFSGFAQNLNTIPASVRNALGKAGKNKSELQKFIAYCHQTGDLQKIKAAYFLIENMDSHFSMDYFWEDKAGRRIAFNELEYANFDQAISAFQKIKSAHPGLHPHPFKSDDLSTISSAFLIKNIDHAFLQWRGSNNYKKIPFNDFCEYILPYRISVEPLQPWRGKYQRDYNWIAQKYRSEGLAASLSYVSTDFRNWFTNSYSIDNRKEPLPRLGALQLLLRRKGPCEDIADLVVFALRSQGIPATVNFIPFWATSTSSHFLNSVFDEHMRPVSLDVAGSPPVNNVLAREPSKVLRLTYSKQPGTIAEMEKPENIPPGFMRTANYIDVTRKYWSSTSIKCKLLPDKKVIKYAYACVFNGMIWRPTWWSKVAKDEATFDNMPKGVVYLPVYYSNAKITPAGYPVAQGYNHQLLLAPDTLHKRVITIKEDGKHVVYRSGKNYRLLYWDNSWRLIGQRIATADSREMLFANVPENALLLLVPEYSERKERPFIFTNNEIQWF